VKLIGKKIYRERFCRELEINPFRLRPRWIPDSEQLLCYGCSAVFGVTKRKHHCRCCGKIFCHNCTKTKVVLPNLQYNRPVRICDRCHIKLYRIETKKERSPSNGFKLVVLGSEHSGKSSLINRFIKGTFSSDMNSTVGANFLSKSMVTSDGKVLKLQIWDTAGHVKFYDMVKMYYVGCSSCLLIYDPQDTNALRIPEMWITKIMQEGSNSIVFALAGSKCDLPESQRKISRMEVLKFVFKYQIDLYFETSAKENHGVEELFQEIVETMVTRLRE